MNLPGIKRRPFLNQTISGFGLAPETLQLNSSSSCSLISTFESTEYPVMLIDDGGTENRFHKKIIYIIVKIYLILG